MTTTTQPTTTDAPTEWAGPTRGAIEVSAQKIRGASSHTPGPWYKDAHGKIREAASDRVVCEIDDGGHIDHRDEIPVVEQYGNGALIAAAPRLLEACKRLVHEAEIAEYDDGPSMGEVPWDEITRLQAVIDEATASQ